MGNVKKGTCKIKKSQVAEVIVIKKDINGEIISKKKTIFPQKFNQKNQGNLISTIEDWRNKLGPIKKIKKMPAKILKKNLTNLLKDKLQLPKKIIDTKKAK